MKYDRTVIAYHGCDAEIADRLLRGEPFKKSQNDYDWLGEGIYFWEYGANRALRFAHDQKRRSKVKTPAIVGALIQLGRCFDLMDTRFTEELPVAFRMLKNIHDHNGEPLPTNAGKTPDKLLRRRDCAVFNLYLDRLEERDCSTTPYAAASLRVHQPTKVAASSIRATSRSPSETSLAWWVFSGPQWSHDPERQEAPHSRP